MARLNWTTEAENWVQEIYDYIATDSPRAAKATAKGIQERVQILRQFPRIGARHEPTTDKEVRILLYGHYRIAYVVLSEEEIDIIGVFHGSMDMDRLL